MPGTTRRWARCSSPPTEGRADQTASQGGKGPDLVENTKASTPPCAPRRRSSAKRIALTGLKRLGRLRRHSTPALQDVTPQSILGPAGDTMRSSALYDNHIDRSANVSAARRRRRAGGT